MYSENDLGTQETPITVVGMEFVAGPEGNAQISEALGYTVHRFPTGECYHTQGGYLMSKVPDYCADEALCLDMLEKRGIIPMVLPAVKPKGAKKFEPGFVAVFETGDELHATMPQLTEAAAVACALLSIVEISHD